MRIPQAKRTVLGSLVAIAAWAPAARAAVIVTLEPRDTTGTLITGSVSAGSELVVDILLSVDEQDDPLADVRVIQFDFAATDSDIELGAFAWRVDPTAYTTRPTSLPTPSASTLATGSGGNLLTLTRTPERVATIDITVNATATLNAVGPTAPDRTSEARITAGFELVQTFSLFDANLIAGELEIPTSGASPVDSDGDGVPDSDDAFPDNANESVDTDGDGVGDNADQDDDDDGTPDTEDDFPLDSSETTDSDGDGVGDNTDAFPDDPEENLDSDGDGIGDRADPDDDNDGTPDSEDAFPLDPTEQLDSDGDGVGDNAEMDTNTGPRATGSLRAACGSGFSTATAASLALLMLVRFRRRD